MRKEGLHNKKDGFRLPDKYFSELEDRIFSQTSLDEMIRERDGFRIPHGYFENFEKDLFSQIEKDKTKVIPLFGRKKLIYSLVATAAVLTLIFGLRGVLFGGNSDFDLSVSQVESYLDNGILNVGPYDLADLFDDETLSEITMDTGFDKDALMEYLIENGDPNPMINFDE